MTQPDIEQLKEGSCDCPLPVGFWLYVDDSDTETPNVPYCRECLRQIIANEEIVFYMANDGTHGAAVRNNPLEAANRS
jgi:hypothetical protein